jgi:hypothetical protein
MYQKELKQKAQDKELKIIIIGSRGIPCTYGSFETFAEWLCYRIGLKD